MATGDAPIVVVGAGIGGLAAAARLAAQGFPVTVLEKAAAVGGKMRQISVDGAPIDAGPTVLTMRWVFEELFEAAGANLEDSLTLRPAEILARHAWSADERLDLYADLDHSVAAIQAFAGPREAEGYRMFCARAGQMFETLDTRFIRTQRPRLDQLVASYGLFGLGKLRQISPFATLWSSLADHFRDPRLRQLFGRYATYCGSSPFLAPATLMLVAHVERVGVWYIDGGMHRLAQAVADLAQKRGAEIHLQAPVATLETKAGAISGVRLASGAFVPAAAVILNTDVAALTKGLFGESVGKAAPATTARSLSAVTFAMRAKTAGFPLVRHNVFFARDYQREFAAIFDRGRIPDEPTVYVCAQDRADDENERPAGERLLALVNAPACGDTHAFTKEEMRRCETNMHAVLDRCGLTLSPMATEVTHPGDFETLFPATGGALYGPASHGWQASFNRSGARTKVPGLYLAGGSVHPGPGVPMAATSGRLAATALIEDHASILRSRRTAMPGGISTR
jgi:1-hydroxycarotenoid 3,4-desaturase